MAKRKQARVHILGRTVRHLCVPLVRPLQEQTHPHALGRANMEGGRWQHHHDPECWLESASQPIDRPMSWTLATSPRAAAVGSPICDTSSAQALLCIRPGPM